MPSSYGNSIIRIPGLGDCPSALANEPIDKSANRVGQPTVDSIRRQVFLPVRRCSFCKTRFSTQERSISGSHLNRKWPGPRPSRNGWKKHRAVAVRGKCEVESSGVDFKQAGVRLPCGPHCASKAHPAPESRESRLPWESSVHLRNLPRVQAPGRPQAVPGG